VYLGVGSFMTARRYRLLKLHVPVVASHRIAKQTHRNDQHV
jgi:hypothetical protein